MGKVLGTLLIIFAAIFLFPVALGIGGAIFGLLVGLIGGLIGLLAGILGMIVAIPAFLFELLFGGIPIMAGLAIVFFILVVSGAIAGRQRRAPKTETNS
jgi:hypothetical protein